MLKGRLPQLKTTGRRALAAAPMVMAVSLAVMGVAMSASSSPRPDLDRTAEAVARATGGDLTPRGLKLIMARLDAGQLTVARRFDPTTMDDVTNHYAAARAPLDAAIELDPERTAYRDALTALAADEARAQTLAAQHAVARANAEAALPAALPGGAQDEAVPATYR